MKSIRDLHVKRTVYTKRMIEKEKRKKKEGKPGLIYNVRNLEQVGQEN